MASPKPKSKFVPGSTLSASDSGVNYFRGSKVGSATGYIAVAGQVLAVPHSRLGRAKSATGPRIRFDGMSEYQTKFREAPYCYCSMDRKPLSAYDPLSYRSRLAVEDAPVPYKNASIVNFHDGIHTCHKKRFNTTNQTFFTGEPCDPRSNQGILSEFQKFRNTQRHK
eukprot:gnl/MRDRNA2_/MRDRNA2_114131_c0_seq1.p1 gnl/MRDRNA2_/MRDRNA2_114131_c0~~gnl/MRDRNA2_/MRDRNA2_114131_c0_seq1.p1  ORF type:complete len:167 (+),score=25.49 gnl/MRDRNA2_/MRDRNA2_114131_c0_seq1:72-572(+)